MVFQQKKTNVKFLGGQTQTTFTIADSKKNLTIDDSRKLFTSKVLKDDCNSLTFFCRRLSKCSD